MSVEGHQSEARGMSGAQDTSTGSASNGSGGDIAGSGENAQKSGNTPASSSSAQRQGESQEEVNKRQQEEMQDHPAVKATKSDDEETKAVHGAGSEAFES